MKKPFYVYNIALSNGIVKYNGDREEEKALRYDNYCCIVFNILEKVFKFYNGDKIKIEKFLGVREMIVRHKTWWQLQCNQHDIVNGYLIEFVTFADSYLK